MRSSKSINIRQGSSVNARNRQNAKNTFKTTGKVPPFSSASFGNEQGVTSANLKFVQLNKKVRQKNEVVSKFKEKSDGNIDYK